MEDVPDSPWLRQPVQLQLLSGHLRYLLDVRKERCCECPTGTRVVSIWTCAQGDGEAVSWCGHCFNAACETAPLDERQQRRFEILRSSLERKAEVPVFPAARLALEHLARQGML